MLKTILVAATLGLAALPAQAAMMQAVYTGTMFGDYSYDYTGLFGSVGSLDGMGVTATFNYDTDAGYHMTHTWGEVIAGGSSYGGNYMPFFMSAKITIAGHSASTTGGYDSYAATFNSDDDGSSVEHISTQIDATTSLLSQIVASMSVSAAPQNLHTPFSTDGFGGGGQFFFASNGGDTDYQATGYFHTDHVSITSLNASPVPLPASFSMGLAALAGLVLMGRRRRAA